MPKIKLMLLACGLTLTGLSCTVAQKSTSQNRNAETSVSRILILGNSITRHGPAPAIGWQGNWGMAASAADKDFVHLLETMAKENNPSVQFMSGNIANTFERKFWNVDTTDFQAFKKYNADLIILKIGENVSDSLAVTNKLGEHIESLTGYVSNKRNVKVCLVGSFWPKPAADQQMKQIARQKNWDYVSLEGLYKDRHSYTAIDTYDNPGIKMHPSDDGMKAIADRIWHKINYLFH